MPLSSRPEIRGVSGIQRRLWRETVASLSMLGPCQITCQAVCLGLVTGYGDLQAIKHALSRTPPYGSPMSMAIWATSRVLGYEFCGDASIEECRDWLEKGDLLIVHGWFTPARHAVVLDGVSEEGAGREWSSLFRLSGSRGEPSALRFTVCDPWAKFDAGSWAYPRRGKLYDGSYTEDLLYAACAARGGPEEARRLYREGEVCRQSRRIEVHRFKGWRSMAEERAAWAESA